MSNLSKGPDYVEDVRRDTQEYIRDLLEANANLRRLNASYRSEIDRRKEEAIRYQQEMLALQERLQLFEREQQRLRRQLLEVEDENRSFSQRYVEVEQQNNNLANLYVATYRLSETLDRDSVLEALNEIIINLIGSEEFAIVETSNNGSGLSVLRSHGLSSEQLGSIDTETGPVARAARQGELWVSDNGSPAEKDLVACVPLAVSSRVYGVIVIFGLLAHKPRLEPLDFELFDLLASHGAMSLHAASLNEQTTTTA